MESITSLLDAFTKLADQIINLKKTKIQDQQQIFNEIAKPLFEELEPIALNYIHLFRSSQEMLENPAGRLLGIARVLRTDRSSILVTRIKIKEMAKQIRKNIRDESLSDFVILIDGFFSNAHNRVGEAATKSKNLIELIEESAFLEKGRMEIIAHLSQILTDTEKEWASIVRSYGKIKIDGNSSKVYV